MKQFLIWSNEHGAWWRANSCGYTTAVAGAGVYTKEEAEKICKNANHDPARCDEEMRPAVDYVDELLSDDWKSYLGIRSLYIKKELTDDDIRAMWTNGGGTFHGPITETATMTEERIIKFIRNLV